MEDQQTLSSLNNAVKLLSGRFEPRLRFFAGRLVREQFDEIGSLGHIRRFMQGLTFLCRTALSIECDQEIPRPFLGRSLPAGGKVLSRTTQLCALHRARSPSAMGAVLLEGRTSILPFSVCAGEGDYFADLRRHPRLRPKSPVKSIAREEGSGTLKAVLAMVARF